MEPEGSLPFHKSPPLVTILSQIIPVHTIPFCLSKIHFNIVYPPTSWSSEPFFNTYITTRQDGGLRNHLLLDAMLQASQVEAGISRKETEDNAGSVGTSQTDSVSETGVEYGVESNRSGCKETRTVEKKYKLNTIRYRNMI
jgi:hypothetical protein